MEFQDHFPIWSKLTAEQKDLVSSRLISRSVKKGTIVHNGGVECTGLLFVRSGQLRAYFLSDEGRQITLYRLFDLDLCMLSAACIMNSLQFDIIIEAEKDSEFWVIPPDVYKQIMQQSAYVANYTNELMAARFSDVMWLVEQVMWKSLDKRLSAFLAEEAAIEESNVLKLTHENIANHLGTQREVITRMLKYFQAEGIVKISRGTIEITDLIQLNQLSGR